LKAGHVRRLRVGVALDEGLAREGPRQGKSAAVDGDASIKDKRDVFTVFHGERAAWWIRVKATGPTGHGSRFVENTAVMKLMKVVNHLLALRKEQELLYRGGAGVDGVVGESAVAHEGCSHAVAAKLGDVATVNLTMLNAGVPADGTSFTLNVIPSEFGCK
jgi:aminoacylase